MSVARTARHLSSFARFVAARGDRERADADAMHELAARRAAAAPRDSSSNGSGPRATG